MNPQLPRPGGAAAAEGLDCPAVLRPVLRVVLGPSGARQLHVLRSLMAAYVYALCVALLNYAAHIGMIDPGAALGLSVYITIGVLGFYAMLRADLTRHWSDAALVLPQCLFAVTAIVAAYAIAGPPRGTVLMLLALVMAFGMFNLTPRQSLVICVFAIATLGGAMLLLCRLRPEEFVPQVEAIQFGVTISVLPTMALVAKQVGDLRDRLLRQRRDLHEALARVQELATRDSLTGLINRRHMQEMMDQEFKRQERSGSLFCVAIIDLDHFKQINDTHGHQVGDEVLVSFARESAEVLRNADVMARWGGEEFLILFPETRADQALNALERLREHVARRPMTDSVSGLLVTFSAGVAEHAAGQSVRQTLERADRALYLAKSSGRNRCALAA